MKYEIDNTLTKSGERWRFSGQLIEGTKKIPISETVADLKTDGMIKRAILEKVEAIINDYQKQPAAQVKTLTEDAIFKSKLQAI